MSKNNIMVAVVDDDESFARAVGRLLRASGFDTVIHHSAEDFLRQYRAGEVHCLVVDVHLGGMPGTELGRCLAAQDAGIPVVYVSALEVDEPASSRHPFPCHPYFRKPVAGSLLIKTIKHLVHTRFPATRKLEVENPQPHQST